MKSPNANSWDAILLMVSYRYIYIYIYPRIFVYCQLFIWLTLQTKAVQSWARVLHLTGASSSATHRALGGVPRSGEDATTLQQCAVLALCGHAQARVFDVGRAIAERTRVEQQIEAVPCEGVGATADGVAEEDAGPSSFLLCIDAE